VRIALDPGELRRHPLRIGLSTNVTVDVHDDAGAQLAQSPPREPVLATGAFDIDRAAIIARIAQIIRENTREGSAPPAAE
jgi:membrane fusion protein (multidrug efflux system)